MSDTWWYVIASVGSILFPIIFMKTLQHSARFNSLAWSIREHDYPMPQPNWTVADLHKLASHNFEVMRYNNPLWPGYNEKKHLRLLLKELAKRPAEAVLTPHEIDAWLTIRDLRGT